MYKGLLLVFILSLLIRDKIFSQSNSIEMVPNIIFLEAGGTGGYGSLNYERVLYVRNHLMFAIRIGLSSYHIKDYTNTFNPDILIPIAVNGYYGHSHKIEWGLGGTFSNIVKADLTDFRPERTTNFHTTFSIGYRYQRKTGGMIFRCAYTPIIEFNKFYRHWAGISMGYAF